MADEVIAYPTGPRLVLLLVSVFLSMFLVALDRLIIATAIPQITDDFKSQTDIGWYGSAYLLTTCASQLLFGKLYTYFSIKALFLATVLLFEVGSALCGAAPNSIAFILGRAIAGIGAAGISSGGILLIVFSLPLHKRPLFQGLFGAVFGIASVVGPVVGGALTTHVTWRWCFYINLPFGGVAMAVILFLLQVPDRETTKIPTKDKLAQLDVYGTVLFVPGCICLILALQWGGVTYSWNNGRMIALLVLAGLLLLGFVMVQILLPKTATIPPRIFKQRSILSGFFTTVCIGSEMMIFTYYLPIWFQAIQGVSAVQSGIRILPLVLSLVIGSLVAGALTHRIGYYTPLMIGGVCFMSIGAGLLYTLQVDTSEGQWIGYQILYGWGMGLATQAPNLAAQTVLSNRDIPIGTSLLFFAQLLGGAIFVSVGQNVLDNQLLKRLSSVPGFGASWIENNGATSLTGLPASVKPTVIAAYNESLRQVFLVGLILVCLIMPGTLGMEWLSVKKNMKTQEKKSDEDGRMEDNTKKNIPRPDEPETKTSVSVPVGADEEAGEEKEINL
ncbi:MFS aflatoxin efflux [Pleurostoma richardsiae]|uniref:MFS aflatoxin efflux n=1 Tax=Pleurostoma richardsiae TaxID=41990 RepID=A0AA38VR46_9PEZI|nr:MFS aflatoxin efflux [Pleurostoma richardsiae]